MSSKSEPIAVTNLKRIWNLKKSEMKITQAQAAKELGWTQGAFSQYLNNLTELNAAAVIKLANFLGVDPEEIDPDINNHLPNLSKTEVRFRASNPNERVPDRTVYSDITLRYFLVELDEPVKGAPELPIGTLILCHDPKPGYLVPRGAKLVERHYLICYKDAEKFEYISESDCPPKTKLKFRWLVHAFIIH